MFLIEYDYNLFDDNSVLDVESIGCYCLIRERQ